MESSNPSTSCSPSISDSDSNKRKVGEASSEVPNHDAVAKSTFEKVTELHYKEAMELIEAGTPLEKLTLEKCKAYLRTHKLILSGNKPVLLDRIREHLKLKDRGGEANYPQSSFKIKCQGDVFLGDVILFAEDVYAEYDAATGSPQGLALGRRMVAVRVIAASEQRRSFTLEVIWSKGVRPLTPLSSITLTGRQLDGLNTFRQIWSNEDERKKVRRRALRIKKALENSRNPGSKRKTRKVRTSKVSNVRTPYSCSRGTTEVLRSTEGASSESQHHSPASCDKSAEKNSCCETQSMASCQNDDENVNKKTWVIEGYQSSIEGIVDPSANRAAHADFEHGISSLDTHRCVEQVVLNNSEPAKTASRILDECGNSPEVPVPSRVECLKDLTNDDAAYTTSRKRHIDGESNGEANRKKIKDECIDKPSNRFTTNVPVMHYFRGYSDVATKPKSGNDFGSEAIEGGAPRRKIKKSLKTEGTSKGETNCIVPYVDRILPQGESKDEKSKHQHPEVSYGTTNYVCAGQYADHETSNAAEGKASGQKLDSKSLGSDAFGLKSKYMRETDSKDQALPMHETNNDVCARDNSNDEMKRCLSQSNSGGIPCTESYKSLTREERANDQPTELLNPSSYTTASAGKHETPNANIKDLQDTSPQRKTPKPRNSYTCAHKTKATAAPSQSLKSVEPFSYRELKHREESNQMQSNHERGASLRKSRHERSSHEITSDVHRYTASLKVRSDGRFDRVVDTTKSEFDRLVEAHNSAHRSYHDSRSHEQSSRPNHPIQYRPEPHYKQRHNWEKTWNTQNHVKCVAGGCTKNAPRKCVNSRCVGCCAQISSDCRRHKCGF